MRIRPDRLARCCFAVLGLIFLSAAPAGAEQAKSVAVIDVILLDTSTEGAYFGARDDEAARIELLRDRLAEAFAETGLEMVDASPAADKINTVANIARSNGMDAKIAGELGADLAVTAEVQKVSNLILTINVVVRSARTGEVLRAGNADIRSNTDESWLRGLNYILKNRIFTHGSIDIG